MSYEPEEENDNNGKDSIIHISSDNINSHETNKKKGKNLKKYQKYVKNVEYDEFNDDNNIQKYLINNLYFFIIKKYFNIF